VQRTATLSGQAMLRALLDAEERLGRRLDEDPRPHLCAPAAGLLAPDVFALDLDDASPAAVAAAAAPGAQHAALWLCGDLWAGRAWCSGAAARCRPTGWHRYKQS